MNHARSGFIIPLVFVLASAIIVVATALFVTGSIYVPYLKSTVEQEKARFLALGGIQIAVAQLAQSFEKEQPEQETQEQTSSEKSTPTYSAENQRITQFLSYLLTRLNRWQKFDIIAGGPTDRGTIDICLTSEDGKIDLNTIYDFKKHKFVGEDQPSGGWKSIMMELSERLGKLIGSENLFSSLEKYLRLRKYAFNDVTELLAIDEFKPFGHRVYYEPITGQEVKKGKTGLALTDIFTVYSGRSFVEPWLLSESIRTILELNPTIVDQKEDEQAAVIQEQVKNFKRINRWVNDWHTVMAPRYGKELQTLPKGIESVFSTIFDPQHFAVLSHGTFGSVTQRLYAVLERRRASQAQAGEKIYEVVVKRVYWL